MDIQEIAKRKVVLERALASEIARQVKNFAHETAVTPSYISVSLIEGRVPFGAVSTKKDIMVEVLIDVTI